MPSFDIVSKTDLAEIDNALANMIREMSQRYDFKGSQSRIERKEAEITINADDELKLKQMHELLQGHLARRKIEPGVLDYKTVEKAAGQAVRQKGQDGTDLLCDQPHKLRLLRLRRTKKSASHSFEAPVDHCPRQHHFQ